MPMAGCHKSRGKYIVTGRRGALPLTPTRGAASGLRQGAALHPRRVFDPLDTHFAIELSALSYFFRVLIEGDQGALPLTLSHDCVEHTLILLPRVDWSTKKAVRCLCRIALFRWILRMGQYPPHSARASFSVAEFASGWKKITCPSLLSRMKSCNVALVSCAKSP